MLYRSCPGVLLVMLCQLGAAAPGGDHVVLTVPRPAERTRLGCLLRGERLGKRRARLGVAGRSCFLEARQGWCRVLLGSWP